MADIHSLCGKLVLQEGKSKQTSHFHWPASEIGNRVHAGITLQAICSKRQKSGKPDSDRAERRRRRTVDQVAGANLPGQAHSITGLAVACRAGTHFAQASAFEHAEIDNDTDSAPTRWPPTLLA